VVCVVEEPHNIVGIETTRQFSGLYHVLHGSLSPLRAIGPEQLKIKNLLERIGQGSIREVILATTRLWRARRPPSIFRSCSSRWVSK